MSETDIILQKAYEKYKLIWVAESGYTIADLFENFVTYTGNVDVRTNVKEKCSYWEYEYGFNGSIYACYEEFVDNELKDENIAKKYLTNDELNLLRGVL